MKESLKDILSHLDPEIDQEMLLLYLQGKLSASQQHDVEKGMMEDDFKSDALEGLTTFKDKKKLELLVDQLNRDLKKRTEKKRRFREKLKLRLDPWVIIAVIAVLLIAIVGFILIHYNHSN
jgi:hypothetical protein